MKMKPTGEKMEMRTNFFPALAKSVRIETDERKLIHRRNEAKEKYSDVQIHPQHTNSVRKYDEITMYFG